MCQACGKGHGILALAWTQNAEGHSGGLSPVRAKADRCGQRCSDSAHLARSEGPPGSVVGGLQDQPHSAACGEETQTRWVHQAVNRNTDTAADSCRACSFRLSAAAEV